MSEVKMVITDLDGTLLQSDHTISLKDSETLHLLGEMGICRVAATGRNLFKVRQVLNSDSPFDFVVVSSGAGIVNWKSQQLIRSLYISQEETGKIIEYLIESNQNFKVSRELPDNHNFGWWESYPCSELNRYVTHHQTMGNAIKIDPQFPFSSSQLLMFFPRESDQFELMKQKLQSQFPELSLIKTTSPLNPDYIWMEIFPKGVSKADGIAEICRITGIARENTLGIGNDFNDLEMLDFTRHSYVVDNAPEELKSKYLNSLAHYDDGFSHAVNQHIHKRVEG